MKKIITVILTIFVKLFLVLFVMMLGESNPNIQAQVTTGKIPELVIKDPVSAEGKRALQKLTVIQDTIENVVTAKYPKWRLKIKKAHVGDGSPPSIATAYLRWMKKDTRIDVKVFLDKDAASASEKYKSGTRMMSRGIVTEVADVGDECYFTTDLPGEPSSTVNLRFRKNDMLIDISVTNQSEKRLTNEQLVKELARVVDSVLENLKESQTNNHSKASSKRNQEILSQIQPFAEINLEVF